MDGTLSSMKPIIQRRTFLIFSTEFVQRIGQEYDELSSTVIVRAL